MTGIVPYLFFTGVARDALTFYRDVFGGEVELHTFEEFGRTDGPGEAVAHGALDGPVPLFASDGADGELRMDGLVLALLGAAEPAVMGEWFARLSAGGTVVDPLQERPWGDSDGRVTDRFGVAWLLGYSG